MSHKIFILALGLLVLTGCNRPYLFHDPAGSKAKAREKMGVKDVISLTKAGLSDEIIISKIRQAGATFNLSSRDLQQLRSNQVTEKVITYMLTRKPKRRYKKRRRSYIYHYYYDSDPWCRPYQHRIYGQRYYYYRPAYHCWR